MFSIELFLRSDRANKKTDGKQQNVSLSEIVAYGQNNMIFSKDVNSTPATA